MGTYKKMIWNHAWGVIDVPPAGVLFCVNANRALDRTPHCRPCGMGIGRVSGNWRAADYPNWQHPCRMLFAPACPWAEFALCGSHHGHCNCVWMRPMIITGARGWPSQIAAPTGPHTNCLETAKVLITCMYIGTRLAVKCTLCMHRCMGTMTYG